jgi:hypothetical protein
MLTTRALIPSALRVSYASTQSATSLPVATANPTIYSRWPGAKRKSPGRLKDQGLRWIPEALEVSGLTHQQ